MPSGAGRTHTAEAARRMGRSSTGAILAGRRHTASVQRPDATAAIRARIREHGPIGFDTFMELALYGPGGFYERPPVGADGDFVTSPHVHPAFGMFVARALAPLHDALALGGDLRLTEVGAGDGMLASQILGSLDRIRYTAVEISAGARAALAARERVEVADELRPPVDLVLAHELLDNLPFRLVRDGEEVTVGRGRRRFRRTDAGTRPRASCCRRRPSDRRRPRRPDGRARVHRSRGGLARPRLRPPDRLRR